MEKTFILCPKCGQRLAELLGETGQRQRLKPLGTARVSSATNALGEDLAWIRCPKCRSDRQVNPAHFIGES